MTPDDLRAELARRQAAGKVDVLAALETAGGSRAAFADQLLQSLMLTGDLSVAAPAAPALAGDRVTLAGTAALLGMADVPVALTFLVGANGMADLEVAATPASWALAQSFPALVGEPVDSLALSDVLLFFTSAAALQPNRTDGLSHPIAAAPGGLTLVAAFAPAAAVFGPFSSFLGGALGSLTVSGPIVPPVPASPGLPYPALDLVATIPITPPTVPGFALGSPTIRLRTPDDSPDPGTPFPIAEVGLSLLVGTVPLAFSGTRVQGADLVMLHAAVPAGQTISPATVVQALLTGTDYSASIPDELVQAFSVAGLQSAAITLDLDKKTVFSVSADIGTSAAVPPLGPVTLEQLVLRASLLAPGTPDSRLSVSIYCQFTFLPAVFPGQFAAQAYRTGTTTGFSGSYSGSVKLGDLLSAASDNAIVAPDAVAALTFSDFGISFVKSGGGGWDWSMYGSADILHQIEIAGIMVNAEVQAVIGSTGGAKSYQLTGGLQIGDQMFNLLVDFDGGDKRLTATWTDVGKPLGLADIAGFFGWDMPALPEGLDLGLKQATLYYDFVKDTLAVSAVSANYGTLVFASLSPAAGGTGRLHVVALEPSWAVGLSVLPLIGPLIPSDNAPGISSLQIIASSAPIDADMAALAALFGSVSGAPPVPATLAEGVTVAAMLKGVGGDPRPIVLPLSSAAAGAAATAPAPPADAVPATASPPALGAAPPPPPPPPPAPQYGGATVWFPVGKTVGPATLRRIGIQYQGGALGLLLDASATFSSLSIGLDGLGIVSPLKSFAPRPTLSGLSIAFTAGPVEVAGALLSQGDESYAGSLTVKIDPYLISGSGAFGRVDGEEAFFVFAQIEGQFGGPPAFFVTGFLAGLGHNYALTLPAADQVHNFPFLAGMDDSSAIGGPGAAPLDVLQALVAPTSGPPWLTRTRGSKWIAAGVDFRSFELIYGRALVAATDGKEFEIALLGLAHMALPKGATSDAYAYIELQLDASLKPDEGSFSAIASLTASSYLLTHDCHLTGGFAFCIWFGNNPHAGDFVVTAGGYHPAFVVPSWYPAVDRVGFNWAVGGGVTIKGGAYFALTPTAAMAGGSLEVLYHSGDLKAWLTAYANIMVRWKPFYFTADIGISIGASYRLNLLFTSVTVSVELGATLELYGPPTGGKVHVHWSVISFTISFGASPPDAAALKLEWPEFLDLIPGKPDAGGNAGATARLPLAAQINRGLLREDAGLGWVVRSDELILIASSPIAATEIKASGVAVPAPAGAVTSLNIRPMQAGGVTSTLAVSLTRLKDDGTIETESLSGWTNEVQTSALPAALWGAPLGTGSDGAIADPPATAEIVADLQTGLRMTAPAASEGGSVGPLQVDELLDPLGGGFLPLDPPNQADATPVPHADADSIKSIQSTLPTQESLDTLIATLDPASRPPTCAPLAKLAAAADRLFAEPPLSIGVSRSGANG